MSSSEVYKIEPNGDVVFHIGLKNAFRGPMFVWDKLCGKYGLYKPSEFDRQCGIDGTVHTGKALMDEFRQLFRHIPKMSNVDALVMRSTCDNVIVPKELIPWLAEALRLFAVEFPGGHQQVLADILDELTKTEIRGVAFLGTTVAACAWDVRIDPDDEDSEYRPYNIDKDKVTNYGQEHWFIGEDWGV